jgi:dihydrofolate reductase
MKVVLIVAITADGFIAKDQNHLANWTSKEDKQLFVSLTKKYNVMIMGSNTFKTINRALPDRRTIVYTTKPESILVAGIETTNSLPVKLISDLEKQGVNAITVCGGASIYDMFLRANLVSDMYITIEPIIMGRGINIFKNDYTVNLKLIESKKLNDNTVMLHYSVKR